MQAPDVNLSTDSATASVLSRLPSLTGLRFVAAFLVLLAHTVGFLFFLGPAKDYAFLFLTGANVGVSFFFVLSGFILTWVARPGESKALFWRRRAVKIYPNHLVALAVTVVLMLWAGSAVTFVNTVPTLFLVQSWIPVQEVIHVTNGNTPSWTLACEVLFYLTFPWLLALARRIRDERLWLCVGAVTIMIFAIPAIAQLLPATPLTDYDAVPWLRYWFVDHFPVSRLLEFALGILMARIVLSGRWIGLRIGPALIVAAVGFALDASLPGEFGRVAPATLPLALLIAAVASADVRGSRTPFGGRTMVWLGEISFAFYLVHFPVVSFGPIGAAYPDFWTKKWTLPEVLFDIVATVVISVVLAWLLHTLVEKPAMRRWSRPAAANTPVPASH